MGSGKASQQLCCGSSVLEAPRSQYCFITHILQAVLCGSRALSTLDSLCPGPAFQWVLVGEASVCSAVEQSPLRSKVGPDILERIL